MCWTIWENRISKLIKRFRNGFIKSQNPLERTIFGSVFNVLSPGSTLKDAVALALFLKQENLRPEQVQDFIRLRVPFLHVCSIQSLIHIHWKRFTYQNRQRKSNAAGIVAIF